jgi:methionyl-tRNA formyltransferase
MVRIFDARLQSNANSAPAGQVTAIGGEEITVALNGGTLTVKRMRGEGAKISAAEFAQQVDLKVGDRLG